MNVPEIVKIVLAQEGRTQKWAIERMNEVDPSVKMSRAKMSGIIRGIRNMTGDELLVFCKALKISPDVFVDLKKKAG